jgi:mono/diheme cytochrome c family protein
LGQVVNIIGNGRNEMPNFTGTFNSNQARDIAGYVTERLRP